MLHFEGKCDFVLHHVRLPFKAAALAEIAVWVATEKTGRACQVLYRILIILDFTSQGTRTGSAEIESGLSMKMSSHIHAEAVKVPYYAELTLPKFRNSNMCPASR